MYMLYVEHYRHLCDEENVAMAIVYEVVILGAIFATTNIQATEEVILYEVKRSGGCPGDNVTWNCTMHSSVLEWFCTDRVHRIIDCGANDVELISKTCYDQTLTPIFHNCTSDGRIITSIVEINVSLSNTTWICMNPRNTSVNKSITVTVKVPPAVTLTLNSTRNYNGDNNFEIATVTWKEAAHMKDHNPVYNVTVEPAAQECYSPCVTANQFVELVLAIDREYNVTIITELCNRKLKTTSEPLSILLKGSSPSSDNSLGKVYLAIGVIAGAVIILSILTVRTGLLAFLLRRLYNKRVPEEENQFEESEEVPEPNPEICNYESVKAAFEVSQHATAESPIRMEAGRSLLYSNVMYFASYCTNKIYCYSVITKEWTHIGKKMKFFNPGLAIIDGDVATVGGVKNRKPTNEVWAWRKKRWVTHKKMKVKLSDPAVVMSPRYMYVVAISGNLCIDVEADWSYSVQVYNVRDKTWELVSSLPRPLAGIEVTVCNQTVYVFCDQHSKAYKSTLKEIISSTSGDKVWNPIKCCPLMSSTPTAVDDHVLCIGGGNEESCALDEIHVYDEVADSWNKINKTLLKNRMYSMVEVCNRTVVVVGGISRVTNERDISDRLNVTEIFTLE